MITESGLYVIKQSYFDRFADRGLMWNKNGRPNYYAWRDKSGVIWMVPLSTQVEKYKAKHNEILGHGKQSFFAFGSIGGQERVFLIWNMFPVTEHYIDHAYTVNGKPYIVKREETVREVEVLAKKYITMVQKGFIKGRAVIDIYKELLECVAPAP